ncbi:CheR family methyltransferase [Alkalispirochaeta alkalica]|uniref:CheR family methyltransferase n=1 Tax=Alkalispirochaeta alkalica TaxID=46356 RepID=UPI00036CBFC6|nr:CheR family methyltransferase [Alkalispirochaeta alkalica]
MAITNTIEKSSAENDQKNLTQEVIDFKMVTFTLGGKDYGIDIMRVKEIAKFAQFTYVPNTAPYVRGVYNLRGDIISIIDLRLMFNLPAEQKAEDQPENGLILRLETNMLGVIVDSIDKVVGISSAQVQPPHPIFGDINIKFISGVAEYDGRLYIILDVDRIFSRDEEESPSTSEERAFAAPVSTASQAFHHQKSTGESDGGDKRRSADQITRDFIHEGLQAFSKFHVSPVNEHWFSGRLGEWQDLRKEQGRDAQFTDLEDSLEFLKPFYSHQTGAFWEDRYMEKMASALPEVESSIVHVWNPGCGDGHEAYSIAVMLRRRYPEKQIKIWAGDTDLLKISTAPNLVFPREKAPQSWDEYLTKGKNGFTLAPVIKDSILFEFSDMKNASALPKMDFIFCRDVLSFLRPDEQKRQIAIFEETMKPAGLLILGDNENLLEDGAWEPSDDFISMFRYR